jgi:hypothetical protein
VTPLGAGTCRETRRRPARENALPPERATRGVRSFAGGALGKVLIIRSTSPGQSAWALQAPAPVHPPSCTTPRIAACPAVPRPLSPTRAVRRRVDPSLMARRGRRRPPSPTFRRAMKLSWQL